MRPFCTMTSVQTMKVIMHCVISQAMKISTALLGLGQMNSFMSLMRISLVVISAGKCRSEG